MWDLIYTASIFQKKIQIIAQRLSYTCSDRDWINEWIIKFSCEAAMTLRRLPMVTNYIFQCCTLCEVFSNSSRAVMCQGVRAEPTAMDDLEAASKVRRMKGYDRMWLKDFNWMALWNREKVPRRWFLFFWEELRLLGGKVGKAKFLPWKGRDDGIIQVQC